MNKRIDEIQQRMQELLPNNRFLHTLGVAYLATSLAMKYQQDMERAMMAGLLHDNAKYIGDEKTLSECRRYGISYSKIEHDNPYLLHGILGAVYAQELYGIDDLEIQSAIQWHTTGKPNMTFLEQVIFLADYVEPRRNQPTNPELNIIRATAFENLDLAVYYALDNTLRYLNNTNAAIEEKSVVTFHYYKDKLAR